MVIYPASGTGAWEAALTNTLSPGDRVLMCRTGWFATLWEQMAERLGLDPIVIETDWRRGADVDAIAQTLAEDRRQRIKAVCVVHNEPPPAAPAASTRSAPRSMPRRTLPCCWSIRSPRWPRWTTGTTSGAWMSPSPARRRG